MASRIGASLIAVLIPDCDAAMNLALESSVSLPALLPQLTASNIILCRTNICFGPFYDIQEMMRRAFFVASCIS